jgi:hypothetical protein
MNYKMRMQFANDTITRLNVTALIKRNYSRVY